MTATLNFQSKQNMNCVDDRRRNIPAKLSFEWTTFIQIYSTGVVRVLTVVSWAFYFRIDVCNLCKLLFQTQFLSNYPTIIIICITIFLRFTTNASSMKMNLVTIFWHVTKLLKWSRHYIEIRQGQCCNYIWVTGTCYYNIKSNWIHSYKFFLMSSMSKNQYFQ